MALTSSAPGRRRLRTILLAGVTCSAILWGLSVAGTALVVHVPVNAPEIIVPLASHEWERLPAAVALAARHAMSHVLLTEPVAITEANCHRCAERRQWLIDRGVGADRIRTLPDRVGSTRDEAAAVRTYVEQHAVRRLAVVTSPYHTRRTLWIFRKVLGDRPIEIGVYPASDHSPAQPHRWWAEPYDRAYVSYEMSAIFYYRLRFGIQPARAGGDRPRDGRHSLPTRLGPSGGVPASPLA